MQRRDFCKLMAAAAAAEAMPGIGQVAQATANESLPAGFNKYSMDYAQFCALPPEQRVYYMVSGGSIIETRLDNATWKPTGMGNPPKLPIAGESWDGVPMESPIPGLAGDGPYQPTWKSMMQYDAPEWYQDAKFGIWAHWSPQCVPEAGDWYARNMYIEGQRQYQFHQQHYGHQSRFGYKDLCAQWTLLNWDPDALIARYRKAGARLFISLANHHDGFDAWNSKHQPWNSVSIGPHRDVVGDWAAAARKQGLRFGVTLHEARNWWWFQPCHGADKAGPMAGVNYDAEHSPQEGRDQWWQGLDPHLLYGVKHPYDALPDVSFVKNFYDRTRDLIDLHDPDLLYFDNDRLPLGWGGMNIGAYFYNHNLKTRGKMEAVLNGKHIPDDMAKALVADYERGLTAGIMPYPWQSETCIGDWHYNRRLYQADGQYGRYLAPANVIHWMIDTVSKNGTFILNVPGMPDGMIDSKEIAVLDGVTAWMQTNGEGIYETRPWKIYGEGQHSVKAGAFGGNSVNQLGVQDIRFTRNKANNVIFAHVLGWPAEAVTIQSLGTSAQTNPGRIGKVEVLGTGEAIQWRQLAEGLRVDMPKTYKPPVDYAIVYKISLG